MLGTYVLFFDVTLIVEVTPSCGCATFAHQNIMKFD